MNAILIISIFLLVLISFVVFRSKRASSKKAFDRFPPEFPPSGGGLFARLSDDAHDDADSADLLKSTRTKLACELRERAGAGELESLREAHLTLDASLYREILDTLLAQSAGAPEPLRALCGFITRSKELRSSSSLAEKLLEHWSKSPARASTAELLRITALCDDAGRYVRAITTIFDIWQEGRLPGVSADELQVIFESEYWMLSAEARRSGAGFLLREQLAEIRRRLSTHERRESPPSDEVDGQPSASH